MLLESMKTWYGDTTVDENGKTLNIPNKPIANIIDKYLKHLSHIVRKKKQDVKSKSYSITFDNQGIGQGITKLEGIPPFTNLGMYKPDNLIDTNGRYTFIGWTSSPGSNLIIDWDNCYISQDMTVYARWVEYTSSVTDITLSKEKNPTLTEDVKGFVNSETNEILFCLKAKELNGAEELIVKFDVVLPSGWSLGTSNSITLKAQASESSRIAFVNTDKVINMWRTRYILIEDEMTRIYYKNLNDCKVLNFTESALYYNKDVITPITIAVERNGSKFKGFSQYANSDNVLTDYPKSQLNSDAINLYPIFTENVFSIHYCDVDGEQFSGIHEIGYPKESSYNKCTILDIPTKQGYVFMGYFLNKDGSGESVSTIPMFYSKSDVIVYAKWMNKKTFDAKNMIIYAKGMAISVSKMIFYSTFILQDGKQWIISPTGLNLYTSNGSKISNIDEKIHKGIIPLGVSYISDINTFFVLAKYKTSYYIFYSLDRGETWISISDVTDIGYFNIFDGVGYESVAGLKYFKKMLYLGILYECRNNGIYDCINQNYIIDNSCKEWPRDCAAIGMCILVNGTMYILFHQWGILQVESWKTYNRKFTKVAEWDDSYGYEFDTRNLGSAFSTSNNKFDPNDDFDIDDTDAINKIFNYYDDKEREFWAFKNANKMIVTYDANRVKRISFDNKNLTDRYIWTKKKNKNESYLKDYYNKEQYVPNAIGRPRDIVALAHEANDKIMTITEARDIYLAKEILIDNLNSRSWIGYQRLIGEDEWVLITEEYLSDEGMLDTYEDNDGNIKTITTSNHIRYKQEKWVVRYNESEVNSFVDEFGEKHSEFVRKDKIEQSEVFLDYANNNRNTEEISEQNESISRELAKQYSTEENSRSKEFLNYITGGYEEDIKE